MSWRREVCGIVLLFVKEFSDVADLFRATGFGVCFEGGFVPLAMSVVLRDDRF